MASPNMGLSVNCVSSKSHLYQAHDGRLPNLTDQVLSINQLIDVYQTLERSQLLELHRCRLPGKPAPVHHQRSSLRPRSGLAYGCALPLAVGGRPEADRPAFASGRAWRTGPGAGGAGSSIDRASDCAWRNPSSLGCCLPTQPIECGPNQPEVTLRALSKYTCKTGTHFRMET